MDTAELEDPSLVESGSVDSTSSVVLGMKLLDAIDVSPTAVDVAADRISEVLGSGGDDTMDWLDVSSCSEELVLALAVINEVVGW